MASNVSFSEETRGPQETEMNIDYLSVKQIPKIERETRGIVQQEGPSKATVVLKWATTILFGLVLLACVTASKVSIIGLSRHLDVDVTSNPTLKTDAEKTFTLLFMVLIIPNAISLFRSVWNIVGRSDIPWPSRKTVVMVVISAGLESIGLCLLTFKSFNFGHEVTGVGIMQSGLLLPIIYYTIKNTLGDRLMYFRGLSIVAILFIIAGIGVIIGTIISDFERPAHEIWHLVGIIIIYLSWFPLLNEKINKKVQVERHRSRQSKRYGYSDSTVNNSNISRTSSSSSFASQSSVFSSISDSPRNLNELPKQNEETDDHTEIPCDKTMAWKYLLFSSITKLILIPTTATILLKYDISGLSFESTWNNGWAWTMNDNPVTLFIIHTITSVLGYVVGVFACHTCMDRGAFIVPLLLSSPLSSVLLIVENSCQWVFDWSETSKAFCDNSGNTLLHIAPALCFLVALSLTFGRIIWNTRKMVLLKETQLFWTPTYNSVLLEQWFLLNRKFKLDIEKPEEEFFSGRRKKTRVYICSTMYRENRKEMQQLLESIGRISQVNSETSDIHFESHVFLDGAVKAEEMSDFSLQLISLLQESLNLEDLRTCTKTLTPYGMKLVWKLPGACEMTFTIHMKDNKKVKNKKRWSQIMYMSYVLDFLIKQNVDSEGRVTVSDSDCFILTTDADVKFTPESVEALLDLMKRDESVGAVCARTHPLGEGPLVWYQKFEYAIGHWFQKAAEHVLGSVLCAPGCFSVYRCSALKDIVPTYASTVERAFDFLIKDMGEDRWLCTLMVQSGWRIEYCAASENETYCPEQFEEFYKQRRRWIASTLANIISLIKDWRIVRMLNHRVSFLFCIYQIFLLASTFIGPSTVLIIVSGGLAYAWEVDLVTTVVLQVILCVFFVLICLFKNQKWQMTSGKLITFLYALLMAAVVVGIAEQIAEDFIPQKAETERIGNQTRVLTTTMSPAFISEDFRVSFVTLYLGLLAGIFLLTGFFHPTEFWCLVYGVTYLLCLPSGYLVLNIYSVCNITDRSWGTREEKVHNSVKESGNWYDGIETVLRKIFFSMVVYSFYWWRREPGYNVPRKRLKRPPTFRNCCDKNPKDSGSTPRPGSPALVRVRRTSSSEFSQPQRLSQSIGSGFKYDGAGAFGVSMRKKKTDADQQLDQVDEVDNELYSGSKDSSEEDSDNEDIQTGVSVEKWLSLDMQKLYLSKFKQNGYENTIFIKSLTEVDLKRIGVDKFAHRRNIFSAITDLPEYKIDVSVPDDVHSWLDEIGLSQYEENFTNNGITTVKEMEILKSFGKEEITNELQITKPGHVRRLQDAIACLRNPTQEELINMQIRETMSVSFRHSLKDINKEEYKFWMDLIRACLQPKSDAFGWEQELKKKLVELRNEWLMVSGIVNCLWIVVILTLSASIDLQVAGTNPLSLVFLIIFGFIFVLQFFCMLVHRFTTLSHFIARAPYRFGQGYRTAISFGPHRDSEEEMLQKEAKQSERIGLARAASKWNPKKPKKKNTDEKISLVKASHNPDYQGVDNQLT